MPSRDELRLQNWIQTLNEPDDEMSTIAAGKLAELNSSVAVPHLIKALRRTPNVAVESATALGKIGDKSAVPALIELLDRHSNVHVQTAAATALGRLQATSAIPVLKKTVTDYIEEHKTDRLAMTRGYRRGLFTTCLLALKQIGTRDAVRFAERAETASAARL
ncbi:MAG: HEAT repeat domain-containing protein [Anaerolineae bacterium]|nr:HEAT repeat domain-containing protein [Anaerolineae bacterium]MCA9892802.1 HEAT repeat domain-containing protein [Anaerolineae bacterium]MCB9458436.1 HEAT repeat domain-containing protein [Anaerolineaceae bacterium]